MHLLKATFAIVSVFATFINVNAHSYHGDSYLAARDLDEAFEIEARSFYEESDL